MRRRTIAVFATGAALLVPGLLGSANARTTSPTCAPPSAAKTPSAFVIVLFDISRSTDGAPIRTAYRQDFDERISYALANKGGVLYGKGVFTAVGAVGSNSASYFHPLQCVYPHKGSSDNPLFYAYKLKSYSDQVSEAAHRIIDGPRENKGTTLLDALKAVSNLIAPELGAREKYLVLFSDMVEESPRLKMTDSALRPARVAAFIKHERKNGNLPRLDGVQVYVAGAGTSAHGAARTTKRDAIRAFWISYFKAAGAKLDDNNYNGRLLRFP